MCQVMTMVVVVHLDDDMCQVMTMVVVVHLDDDMCQVMTMVVVVQDVLAYSVVPKAGVTDLFYLGPSTGLISLRSLLVGLSNTRYTVSVFSTASLPPSPLPLVQCTVVYCPLVAHSRGQCPPHPPPPLPPLPFPCHLLTPN